MRLVSALKWPLMGTVAALLAAALYGGAGAVGVVALLIGLEMSISFDNAVVNASVLRKLSERWQRRFLTIGILIAVFGMRLVFPIAIVAVAVGASVPQIANEAFTDHAAYGAKIEAATPIIGGFGGAFLLMRRAAGRDRRARRAGARPRRGDRAGRAAARRRGSRRLRGLSLSRDARRVLLAGRRHGGLRAHQRHRRDRTRARRRRAVHPLADGHPRAAQGPAPVPDLRNDAHWAIVALAAILLVSTDHHVPEWITGAIGLGVITAAFASSLRHNRRSGREPAPA